MKSLRKKPEGPERVLYFQTNGMVNIILYGDTHYKSKYQLKDVALDFSGFEYKILTLKDGILEMYSEHPIMPDTLIYKRSEQIVTPVPLKEEVEEKYNNRSCLKSSHWSANSSFGC